MRSSLVAAVSLVLLGAVAPSSASAQNKSLYARLGGYDALAAVTDDFIGRLATDATLGKYFKGHSANSGQRIRQLVVDQLCAVTGGPCVYIGRDMKVSHQGMGITEDEWDHSVHLLKATLAKFKVPPGEQREVLDAIGGLREDIVEMKR